MGLWYFGAMLYNHQGHKSSSIDLCLNIQHLVYFMTLARINTCGQVMTSFATSVLSVGLGHAERDGFPLSPS